MTAAEWRAIRMAVLDRDGRRCQICGRRGVNDVDHIWPTSLGGSDAAENLQAACRSCNSRKGARPPKAMLPLFVSFERLWLCDQSPNAALKAESADAWRRRRAEEVAEERARFDALLRITSTNEAQDRRVAEIVHGRGEAPVTTPGPRRVSSPTPTLTDADQEGRFNGT